MKSSQVTTGFRMLRRTQSFAAAASQPRIAPLVAREQGEWAVRAALEILHGKPPGDVPMVLNQQTRCFVNPELADRVGFRAPAGRACASYR